MDKTNWWERRWFLAFLILASTVPLLWPQIPPLNDVPGHLGRFEIQLNLANSQLLQRYFDFRWTLVGNLGTDLLVQLLAPVMGLEPAVKLIIIAIPPLTVAGLLWTAKEIHGRVPPTTLFAIPFIYNFAFNYGFLNYTLSFGLSLLAFAYWLRLTGKRAFRARTLIFVPISCALWVIHAFGWGILGLLAFSAEFIRLHDERGDWKNSIVKSLVNVAPMSIPLVMMAVGSGTTIAGETSRFLNVPGKIFGLAASLRDQWLIWDSLSVGVGLVLIGSAIFDRHLELSRKLAIPAFMVAVMFLVMPEKILGLTYADTRLAPVMIMLGLLSIRVRADEKTASLLAWLALLFLCLRLAGNTISYAMESRKTQVTLGALDHIPRGARVLFLAGDYCNRRPAMPRYGHFGSMVIVRRHGFSNDQWQAAGAQLLRINYPEAGRFSDDRSAILYSSECIRQIEVNAGRPMHYDRRAETALRIFPRNAFDYVWMVDPPEFEMKQRPGLVPVWQSQNSILYKIDHTPGLRDPLPN